MNLEVRPDMTVTELQRVCHGRSTLAGWWDDFEECTSKKQENAFFSMKIALIHSETSEMLEGLRKGIMDDHLPHRTMEEVEAADILIRLLDYCEARKIDLIGATCEKLDYNAERPDHKPEAREAADGKQF